MFKRIIFSFLFVLDIAIIGSAGIRWLSRPEKSVEVAYKPTTHVVASPAPVTAGEILDEVNAYRVQNGKQPLTANGLLEGSAQSRAEFLCDNDVWSHDGWLDSLTYKGRAMGENLEYGMQTQTARTIVSAWSKSPSHNANMLSDDYTEQGMGLKYCKSYQGEVDVLIVVNHFGAPL